MYCELDDIIHDCEDCGRDCIRKHPVKLFIRDLLFYLNFKNKWHALMYEYRCWKTDVISFNEFIDISFSLLFKWNCTL